jgi:Uncharacterized protein conserved in bacteria (DUF2242)
MRDCQIATEEHTYIAPCRCAASAPCTFAALIAVVTVLCGCASGKHRDPGPFTTNAPYSKTVSGSGDAVCWSVKRALLSQGYMLERATDSGVLTGTIDSQPNPKLNVTTRMQTTCADNRDGTSIVFVTASREESRLQKMKQTTSMGVGPATLTMPSGSAKVLGTVSRETITDPNFYNSFFALVQKYVAQEPRTRGAGERHAEVRDSDRDSERDSER